MGNQIIKSLTCPISLKIFNEPVTLSDGHTYEKDEIIKYLKINNKSPITRNKLNDDIRDLKINYTIKNLVECYLSSKNILKNDIFVKLIDKEFIIKNGKNNNLMEKYIETIDIHNANNDGMYPIHLICKYSTPEMIKFLIELGVNLEVEDCDGMRPIHYICKYSTPEMIKYIIDIGIDLEAKAFDDWRPIHLICRFSTPEMIKYIIDNGVDLEAKLYNDWRPIHLICRFSTPEMIKYIIDKGVDLNAETRDDWRPINFIIEYSTREVLEYIINKDIYIDERTKKECSESYGINILFIRTKNYFNKLLFR